jgi:hypothetical protein
MIFCFSVQVAKYGSQLNLPAESPMESGSQTTTMSQGSIDYRSERSQSAKEVVKQVLKEGEKEGEKEGNFSSPLRHPQTDDETLDLDSSREGQRDSYFRNCKPDAKYCFAELKITEIYPSAVDSSAEINWLQLLPIKAVITEMKDGMMKEVEEEEVTPRSLGGIKRENMKNIKHDSLKIENYRSAKTESEKESFRSFASDFMC